jgi:hypothetical protein
MSKNTSPLTILEEANGVAEWAWNNGEFADLRDKSQDAASSLVRLVCAIQSGDAGTIHEARNDAMAAVSYFMMTAEGM